MPDDEILPTRAFPWDGTVALRAAYRDIPAVEISRVTGEKLKTAHRFQNGQQNPRPDVIAKLMGYSGTIRDIMMRMAGLDDAFLDAEEARLTAELHRLQLSRGRPRNAETVERDAPGGTRQGGMVGDGG